MTIVLSDYWRSSAAYRVRIALALKRVEYDRRTVSLLDGEQRSADNLERNPQGMVPTLEIDGLRLTQSLAIIDYLDARFPDPRLIPADPAARAGSLARALLIAADIHPLNNLRLLVYLKNDLGVDQAGRDRWYRHWIAEGFAALERMAPTVGPFLGGAAPDLADVCLVPQMYNARRLDLSLAPYPRLVAADAAAQDLPAFHSAHPDRFAP